MAVLQYHRHAGRLLALLLFLCLAPFTGAVAHHAGKDDVTHFDDVSFTMLVIGDSQMAGAGWRQGYVNCILETYPGAAVLNLAQNGHTLSDGDILAQWMYYRSGDYPTVDFVLLDGGVNDMPRLQQEPYKATIMQDTKEALCTLIEQIHADCPDTQILYVLMPPLAEWKDNTFGPPAYDMQESFWKQLYSTAAAYDYVTVLDLFSINPFHYPCAECYQGYLADSIHFAEAGYRETFAYINNALMVHLAELQDR